MLYRAIIIDDDAFSASVLAHYCQKSEELLLVNQFTNPQEALAELKEQPVDLIFLDVEMPELNGFELLDQLAYTPYVILFSSKTQYAFLAFEYKVVDFLKKPVLFPRFREAIAKLSRFDNRTESEPQTDDIFIRSEGKLVKIPFAAIYYIEVVDDYIKIVTEKGSHLVLSTLKHIEAKLNKQFIKTHRSFIVNKSHIENLTDGKIHLQQKVIPLSKTHKVDVMRSINIL
ncbi:MAG: LytR/AlgR family response regulator transcription factor [Chitinophagaceae bacterium]